MSNDLQSLVLVNDNDDDLSEEQIHGLLKEAEARLREKHAANAVAVRDFTAADFKLPNLNSGGLVKPQIQTAGEIARLNPEAVVVSQDRVLAKHGRKVEDPVMVKKRAAEVCYITPF